MIPTARGPAPPPPPAPVLVRRGGGPAPCPELDPAQRQVVEHPTGGGPLVVLGAPGTGKTTALVEAVVARVERERRDPSSLLVLVPSRVAAAQLRDRLGARLGRTTSGPLARTPHAYAWALLRRAAVLAGDQLPRLLTGPEQAAVLGELLRGHDAGDGRIPGWPADLPSSVRALHGFQAELRDLLMRALEHGVGPARLAALGREHRRPPWVAAASVLAEYADVVALGSPGAHDPASVVHDAAAMLRADSRQLAAERARWSLVAVEDHQESTPGTAELLDLVCGGGGDLLVVGDPDTTTSTFRGGDPGLLTGASERYRRADGRAAAIVVLGTRWRHGAELSAAAVRVAERIGSVGSTTHRRARPPGIDVHDEPATGDQPDHGAPGTVAPGGVEGHVLASATRQAAFIAAVLRAEHVRVGTGWSAMAVVVRSAGTTAVLRRALVAAGVPVAVAASGLPLRAEPAVAALLSAMDVVLRATASPAHGQPLLAPATALDLITSPLGGADALAVRRLRRSLLAIERQGDGTRSSDELLAAAVLDPGLTAAVPLRIAAPALAVGRVLAAGRAAATAPAPSPQTVIWALWSATGLTERWRAAALAGGGAGERADADLDAVMALFDTASRVAERAPGTSAAQFLAQVRAEDVASDTLAARAPDDDAVTLCTPAAAVGREWDVVVVPGLQEGAWPDTRLRGTLLGADLLADVLAGRGPQPSPQPGPGPVGGPADGSGAPGRSRVERWSARRQVLDDERRLLLVAVTRARRRLVVTAVSDDDERPSAFLDLVAPLGSDEPGRPDGPGEPAQGGANGRERPLTAVPRGLHLSAVVAELRSVLLTPAGARDVTGELVDAARRAGAAAALARLAAAGVPGADPDDWHGLAPLSDERPLREPHEPVKVSPSSVATFTECSLRWLLESCGGGGPTSVSQSVGTLVHAIAAELPDGSAAAMAQRLDELWPTLGMPGSWIGRRERRRAEAAVARLAGYVAAARAAGRELIGVEVEVTAQIGRALVRGRLDRLERDVDGGVRVVDLKTGSSAPASAEVTRHPQLGLYQVLVDSGALDDVPGVLAPGAPGPARSAGAALVQVGAGRVKVKVQEQPALARSPEPAWAHDLLAATADGMAASAFEARANRHCLTCPVATSCPVGQR